MLPLHRYLERLLAETDVGARRAADPVAFVHRYTRREDQELAGLFAAGLAYGRVELFFPVLHTLFDAMDARGGPRAFIESFDADHAAPFADAVYRWTRGADLILLCDGLRGVLERHDSIEALFAGGGPVRARLQAAVDVVRAEIVAAARRDDARVGSFGDLSRGVRHLLPSPAAGSACKRWNLYLRWMVRPTVEGVDLGLWTAVSPRDLLIPLDVHVLRIAQFIGLTGRKDASWRTAEEVTAALRALDPEDPVRFDFAISHLGISGACRGRRVAEVCDACPLHPVCTAPA